MFSLFVVIVFLLLYFLFLKISIIKRIFPWEISAWVRVETSRTAEYVHSLSRAWFDDFRGRDRNCTCLGSLSASGSSNRILGSRGRKLASDSYDMVSFRQALSRQLQNSTVQFWKLKEKPLATRDEMREAREMKVDHPRVKSRQRNRLFWWIEPQNASGRMKE